MTEVVMDRRRERILRDIEREESLQDRHNLTKEQAEWEDAYRMIKRFLQADAPPIDYMVIGFKVAHHAKKSLPELDHENPIIRKDQIHVAFLSPVDSAYWLYATARRPYRLNWMEARIRRVYGDASALRVSTHDDVESHQSGMWQRDALKAPMQDHFRFDLQIYDPHVLITGEPTLSAPFAGKFEISRNEKHVNLLLNRKPVFRMPAKDAEALLTHADDAALAAPGTAVVKGQLLARMQEKTHYGVLRFVRRRGKLRPDIDKILGDVFSATEHPGSGNVANLRMAARMMCAMGYALTDDPEQLRPCPMSQWAPRRLLEFDPEVLFTIMQRDEWEYTPALRDRLLREIGLGGNLFVRSSLQEPARPTQYSYEPEFPLNELAYDDGTVDFFTEEADLLTSVRTAIESGDESFEVNPGDPVANWYPRATYTWDWMRQQAGIGRLCRAFFEEFAIRPGSLGYKGSGVLVDAAYVSQECFGLASGDDYIDLRPASNYLRDGFIIGPPLRQDDWTDFQRTAGGITYNAMPKGNVLSDTPVTHH